MGGYGSAMGRSNDKCYRDSGGHKVKDKNSIDVAEYYIDQGYTVVFLQEKPGQKRADLVVRPNEYSRSGSFRVEVKGLQTMDPAGVDKKIRTAFEQINADVDKYPPHLRQPGKVIIYSRHSKDIPEEKVRQAMYEGFLMAQRKGKITGKVELWINGNIYEFN